MCGATACRTGWSLRLLGLSPRVRGNRGSMGQLHLVQGPIPACAGQPSVVTPRERRYRAYPRVCGATMATAAFQWCRGGLSPRVRGNPDDAQELTRGSGPIPACAGQPWLRCAGFRGGGAYPRVCGATAWQSRLQLSEPGLSPRVRGNREGRIIALYGLGPIPACAGQPQPGRPARPFRRAYPRVCGATASRRF